MTPVILIKSLGQHYKEVCSHLLYTSHSQDRCDLTIRKSTRYLLDIVLYYILLVYLFNYPFIFVTYVSSMGVRGLYKWLRDSFPNIEVQASRCQQLFIDGNNLIVPYAKRSTSKNESEIKKGIIQKLNDIVDVAQPTEAIFLAFHGPVPWKYFKRTGFFFRLEKYVTTFLINKYKNTRIKIDYNSS